MTPERHGAMAVQAGALVRVFQIGQQEERLQALEARTDDWNGRKGS